MRIIAVHNMLVQMYMCNFAILLVVSMKNKYEEDLEMEGTICQGITGAIRELDNWVTGGSCRYAAACKQDREHNQRNHTGEQTCKELVTLAPMMLV